ncbi:uncharacterized protein LOC122071646 [Macadamia integrifolia]|uniref:uncharacterized protein LOC122071646 n=1 Tax=Macadamia integrifolia TaxID=60698 RepID=UPI001C4E7A21|nr:uncharacterized protein LOC122071646 [Macadamia integrifolia]
MPLLVLSEANPRPQNAPFRFHRFWSEHKDFLHIVKSAWNGDKGCPIRNLSNKLKNLKPSLKAWAKLAFPNFDEELKVARNELEAVQNEIDTQGMDDVLFAKEADAKTRLLKVEESYDKLWAEKASLKWMKSGDRNFKFFHLSAKDLFQRIPEELNDSDWAMLESIPSIEDIKRAVWDSAPGPDGFPGRIPNGVNNNFLTLIPKVEGAQLLDKFHPICMANFYYKVLSKIMASRLSNLLPKLISEEQGAFQKGKIISSNVGLAYELVNLIYSSVRRGGMGIKLDV